MGKTFLINQSKAFKTDGNIRKNPPDQSDNYTTACLLDYPYFEKYYKLIVIALSKQQNLDAD